MMAGKLKLDKFSAFGQVKLVPTGKDRISQSENLHSQRRVRWNSVNESPPEWMDGGPEPTEENPVLFQVNWVGTKRTLKRVAVSKSSLNEGDSFILCVGKAKVWCWHGKGVRTH
jgi:hypothetical protein